MKLVTEHLGEIILAIAGVALIVAAILLFKEPIEEFFKTIFDKLTNIGTNDKIWGSLADAPATPNT